MSPTIAAEPRNTPAERRVGTMITGVIAAPKRLELKQVQIPQPGPGQVRIRVESCGVCGSNIPVWEGRDWFTYPLAAGSPGHEPCGRIDALGSGVEGLVVGQRVAALTYHAFAEYDIADAAAVVPLPDVLSGQPFPGEALGCAMNIFRRCGISRGDMVAVVGVGFMGGLLIQLAAETGARVIAISRRGFALEIARRMGASEMIAMDDHGRIIQCVKELTGGRLCDIVIEAVGQQWPLDLAAELTRERGRLVIAGYHQDGPRQVNMQMWNWRGLDVINAHERDPRIYVEGIELAAEAIASGRLDPAPLYTHRFPLSRLDEALEMARQRPEGFLKALVTMEDGEQA
jgi:threonine dehydrogenase-like Zn-dependent dehydrogenase